MSGSSGWLIDTNVVSEIGKRRPQPSVLAFFAQHDLQSLYVSCVTLAELRFGVLRSADSVASANIGSWLDQTIRPMFGDRVLDVSESTMLRWLNLVDQGRRRNHTFSQPDLLIAAQALERDLTVVTRNTRDFEPAGVQTLNPWL